MTSKAIVTLGITVAATITAGSLFARHLSHNDALPRASLSDMAHGVGEQHRWALAFDVALEQPGGSVPVTFRLTGDWLATRSAWRDGEYDVAHEIAGARIEGAGVGSPRAEEVKALERRFGRRFWVTYRSDGAALRVHFPKDVEPTDRNLLQMIVTQTQLVRGDKGATQWTVLERDSAGLYLAAYQSSPGAITKRKLKYVEIDGAAAPNGGDGVEVNLQQSESHFSLDASDQLSAFQGSDRMRVGMPMGQGQGGWLGIRTATQLSAFRTVAAPELRGSLERAGSFVDTKPIRTQKPDPEVMLLERDRRLLDGHTVDALLSAASSQSTDELLHSRLAALFRRQPSAVPAALDLVRKHGGLKKVTNALAQSGASVALDALRLLAHDPTAAEQARIDALSAMMLVQHPSATAMRSAIDLFSDNRRAIRDAARLVSGALARAGRTEHPADAAAVDEALLSSWANASDDLRERGDLLGALGNSAGPTLVPAIEEGLRGEHPEVRTAAARALRFAQGDTVDEMLSAVMTGDSDPGVRLAAIFAAGFRPFDPLVAALVKAATDDKIEYVRADAVRLLQKHSDESTEITTILRSIAEHDPKPGIRRLAGTTL